MRAHMSRHVTRETHSPGHGLLTEFMNNMDHFLPQLLHVNASTAKAQTTRRRHTCLKDAMMKERLTRTIKTNIYKLVLPTPSARC
jgi:hypothetical protein